MQNEIANLIEEKEAAIRQQDFEAAARLRIKEKKLTQQLTEVAFMEVKEASGYADSVTGEDVAAVVSQWTGVPLQQMEKKESERLLDLEKKSCISELLVKKKL